MRPPASPASARRNPRRRPTVPPVLVPLQVLPQSPLLGAREALDRARFQPLDLFGDLVLLADGLGFREKWCASRLPTVRDTHLDEVEPIRGDDNRISGLDRLFDELLLDSRGYLD